MALHDPALLCALIGLARSKRGNAPTPDTDRALIDGLRAAESGGPPASIQRAVENVRRERARLVPGCAACVNPCMRTAEYDLSALVADGEETAAAKALLFSALKLLASRKDAWTQMDLLYRGVELLGVSCGAAHLRPILAEAGAALAAAISA